MDSRGDDSISSTLTIILKNVTYHKNPALIIHELMIKKMDKLPIQYWKHIHQLFEFYEEQIPWIGSENFQRECPKQSVVLGHSFPL